MDTEKQQKDEQWTIRNNGGKRSDYTSLFAIVALVAIIAGVYAMVEPMSQRVDFLETELSDLRSFAASQKDYRLLNNRLEGIEEWRTWWNREVLTNQVQMTEKIKNLERKIYGPALPQISGE